MVECREPWIGDRRSLIVMDCRYKTSVYWKSEAIKECRVETPQSLTDITAIDRFVGGIRARLCSIASGYIHNDGSIVDGSRAEP